MTAARPFKRRPHGRRGALAPAPSVGEVILCDVSRTALLSHSLPVAIGRPRPLTPSLWPKSYTTFPRRGIATGCYRPRAKCPLPAHLRRSVFPWRPTALDRRGSCRPPYVVRAAPATLDPSGVTIGAREHVSRRSAAPGRPRPGYAEYPSRRLPQPLRSLRPRRTAAKPRRHHRRRH
jgi:hypothetical protein